MSSKVTVTGYVDEAISDESIYTPKMGRKSRSKRLAEDTNHNCNNNNCIDPGCSGCDKGEATGGTETITKVEPTTETIRETQQQKDIKELQGLYQSILDILHELSETQKTIQLDIERVEKDISSLKIALHYTDLRVDKLESDSNDQTEESDSDNNSGYEWYKYNDQTEESITDTGHDCSCDDDDDSDPSCS